MMMSKPSGACRRQISERPALSRWSAISTRMFKCAEKSAPGSRASTPTTVREVGAPCLERVASMHAEFKQRDRLIAQRLEIALVDLVDPGPACPDVGCICMGGGNLKEPGPARHAATLLHLALAASSESALVVGIRLMR